MIYPTTCVVHIVSIHYIKPSTPHKPSLFQPQNTMSLAGKVIIVTGGSKGIGRAISHRLAQDGASVVVNFSRDASAADEVVRAIGSDKALAVQADVGSVAGVEKLVAATVERFGRVDVVIPNAGIMPMRTTGNTTEEDFDRAFALNVKGPYFLAQVCVSSYLSICLFPHLDRRS